MSSERGGSLLSKFSVGESKNLQQQQRERARSKSTTTSLTNSQENNASRRKSCSSLPPPPERAFVKRSEVLSPGDFSEIRNRFDRNSKPVICQQQKKKSRAPPPPKNKKKDDLDDEDERGGYVTILEIGGSTSKVVTLKKTKNSGQLVRKVHTVSVLRSSSLSETKHLSSTSSRSSCLARSRSATTSDVSPKLQQRQDLQKHRISVKIRNQDPPAEGRKSLEVKQEAETSSSSYRRSRHANCHSRFGGEKVGVSSTRANSGAEGKRRASSEDKAVQCRGTPILKKVRYI